MLCEADASELVKLLGLVSESDEDLVLKKRLLLSGLCQLIEADEWTWTLSDRTQKRGKIEYLDEMSGEGVEVVPQRASLRPTLLAEAQEVRLPVSWKIMSPREIHSALPDQGSALKRKPTGMPIKERRSISVCLLTKLTSSAVLFKRRAGRPSFSLREEEMVRIICEEIPWLHESKPEGITAPLTFGLPPRQEETLRLLTQGFSRKAISQRLGVSPHTVHGYTKDIYRYFGINSRAALLKRLP
jgi:DNA-binding CsgD family transcriptional regulator